MMSALNLKAQRFMKMVFCPKEKKKKKTIVGKFDLLQPTTSIFSAQFYILWVQILISSSRADFTCLSWLAKP